MDQNILTILAIVVALVIAIGIWLTLRRRHTDQLRDKFGDEYDRTLEDRGDRAKAEADLAAREKRVNELKIRTLSVDEHQRFATEWQEVKATFVDSPTEAVLHADRMLATMMKTVGYPMADFDRRYEDLTVNHADVARHYREGHAIAERQGAGQASTEDLRQAINHYEALFDRLVDDIATPDDDVTVRGTRMDEAPVRPATTDTDAPRPNPAIGEPVVIDRDIDAEGTVTSTSTQRTTL